MASMPIPLIGVLPSERVAQVANCEEFRMPVSCLPLNKPVAKQIANTTSLIFAAGEDLALQ